LCGAVKSKKSWNRFGGSVVGEDVKWLTVALAILATTSTAAAEVAAVHIVSRAGDEGPATDRPKRVRKDQPVTLFAVIETTGGDLFAEVADVELRDRSRRARPLDEGPWAYWIWHKVEPALESMSNTASGKFRFEPIEYGESVVGRWLGRGSVRADVRPTLTTDRGGGSGTMRFKVAAITHGGVYATPGREARRRGGGSGGLSDRVHRITIRRDDSYIGLLTELYGQPYIWASAGRRDREHQSERLEGSDCADFVVYGRRRQGAKIPYTWTGGLPGYTRALGRGDPGPRGVYLDRRGKPLPFPAVGDLVLFPRHVGVLTADRGVPGVLDHEDVMMHSYFASPREQAIGESAYGGTWIEVRRWK
jgi:hypothetical protein